MKDLFLGIFITLSATVSAAQLLKVCRIRLRDEFETLVVSSALGFGILSYVILGIGSFELKGLYFVVLLVAGFIAGFGQLKLFKVFWSWPERQTSQALVVLMLTAAAAALAGALMPAIGQDELCYHLTQPANYVRDGRVYEVPFSTNSLWPYLMEMLFTLGVLFSGSPLAKLFHYFFYLLATGAVMCFVRRYGSKEMALWAGAVYALTPGLLAQASFAYVDHALACYVIFACYFLSLTEEESSLRWMVLAGLMAGFAAAAKLLGIFMVPVACFFFATQLLKKVSFRAVASGALIFFAAMALTGSFWYIRAWILRGNPVFPFYPEFFNGHGWHDPTYVDAHGRWAGHPLSFFLLPWDLAFHPDWFGGERVGPVYLILLPIYFFNQPKALYAKKALPFALLYTLIWFAVDPNVRFLFPGLGLWAVALSSSIEGRWNKKIIYQKWLRAICMAWFVIWASYAVYHYRSEIVSLATGQSQRFLSLNERSHAVAAQVNRLLTPTDKILASGEARGYYFKNSYTLEGDFWNFTEYDQVSQDPQVVVQALSELGFTHILASTLEEDSLQALSSPRRVGHLVRDPQLKSRLFEEVLIVQSMGVKYTLFRIKN